MFRVEATEASSLQVIPYPPHNNIVYWSRSSLQTSSSAVQGYSPLITHLLQPCTGESLSFACDWSLPLVEREVGQSSINKEDRGCLSHCILWVIFNSFFSCRKEGFEMRYVIITIKQHGNTHNIHYHTTSIMAQIICILQIKMIYHFNHENNIKHHYGLYLAGKHLFTLIDTITLKFMNNFIFFSTYHTLC